MSYYYLVSSLPIVNFGEKPFYSSEEFLELCRPWIRNTEYNELANLDLSEKNKTHGIFSRQWYKCENALRNACVRTRSAKLNRDPLPFLRPEEKIYSDIERAVHDALSITSPIEKELALDKLRWDLAEHLEGDEYFSLSKLCAYKLRLLLCEKWLERKKEEGEKNLDAALDSLYRSTN